MDLFFQMLIAFYGAFFDRLLIEPGGQQLIAMMIIPLAVPLMLLRIAHFLANAILMVIATMIALENPTMALVILAITWLIAVVSIFSLFRAMRERAMLRELKRIRRDR